MSGEREPAAPRERSRLPSRVDPAAMEGLIARVSATHGFDIRGYKRTTLYRRICKRMADVSCGTVSEYQALLEADPAEHRALMGTILINVTEFFRDPPAWDFLQEQCLAPLVRSLRAGTPIRVWSIGCASGEEAYSLAIALAELAGDAGMRGVRIYATDVDEECLAVARSGTYPPEVLRNLDTARRERWFEEVAGGRFRIRRELRSAVIFGRHNVLVDSPIARLDLLVCRNLLIYFDPATQQQLLLRFHYALQTDRYLFLGKAETLMTRSSLFRPLETRFRIFQREAPPGTPLGVPV